MSRLQQLAIERGLKLVNSRNDEPQEDIRDLIEQLIVEALSELPKPRSGRDGVDGEKGDKGDRGDIGPMGPKGDPGDRGLDGVNGIDGRDGQDGVSIASLSVSDRSLIIGLSDGKRLVTSIQPVIDRIGSLVSESLPEFFALRSDNPVTIQGNKLTFHDIEGGEVEIVLPESKGRGGGGISGARARAISREISFVSVSSAYTAAAGDDVIEVDTSGGPVTITVPSGRKTWLQIKRSGGNSVTVVTDDGTLIEGETSRVLNLDLWALRIAWNGSEYREF